MEAANNNVHLHVTAGDPGKHPEVLSCQTEITFRKEHVEKVKNELTERGIPRDLLDEKQHLFAIELSCNPGGEKELAQELQKILSEEHEPENPTIFLKVVECFDDANMECKVF